MAATLSYRNRIAQMSYNLATGLPWHKDGVAINVPALVAEGWKPEDIARLGLFAAGISGASVIPEASGMRVTLADGTMLTVPERAVVWTPSPDYLVANAACGLVGALAGADMREKGGKEKDFEACGQSADGREVVGIVGSKWDGGSTQIVDLAVSLAESANGDLQFDTAGRIYDGRRIFIDLAGDLKVSFDGSPVRKQLKLADSFDGTIRRMCGMSALRTVCANTMPDARMNEISALRHTRSIEDKTINAVKMIADLQTWGANWADKMSELATRYVTSAQFREIRDTFLKIEDTETPTPQECRAQETVNRLWAGGFLGADLVDTGSGYALLQCLTEYDQKHRSVRTRQGTSAEVQRGLRSQIGGAAYMQADQAFNLIWARTNPSVKVSVPA